MWFYSGIFLDIIKIRRQKNHTSKGVKTEETLLAQNSPSSENIPQGRETYSYTK
jgi:hypothetical protein